MAVASAGAYVVVVVVARMLLVILANFFADISLLG